MLRKRFLGFSFLVLFLSFLSPVQAETGTLTTPDGVKIFYQKEGSGEKTVIIPGHLFLYPWLEPLAKEYTVIFYDMRDRGRSDYVEDETAITIQKDIDDLEAVRAHFSTGKISLIGWSYLGKMIMLYAEQHPENIAEMIQIGPVPIDFSTEFPVALTANDPEPVITDEVNARFKKMEADNFHIEHPKEYCLLENEIWEKFMVGDPSDPSALKGYKEKICEFPNEWPVKFNRHLDAQFPTMLAYKFSPENAKGILPRVLTIHGTKDRNAPYGGGRQWAYYLPQARLLTIPGAAHMVFVEQNETVIKAIQTFLAGGWPDQAEDVKDWRQVPNP